MKEHTICLAASAGGHISQLLKLSDAWQESNVFFVTTTEVLRSKLQKRAPSYFVGESNRNNARKAFGVLYKCIKIILKEKPTIVISTGALHGCLLCILAKVICNAKIIWIDSITNVDKPSLSGRIIYHFSDLFIFQWPEHRKRYPKGEFVGCII